MKSWTCNLFQTFYGYYLLIIEAFDCCVFDRNAQWMADRLNILPSIMVVFPFSRINIHCNKTVHGSVIANSYFWILINKWSEVGMFFAERFFDTFIFQLFFMHLLTILHIFTILLQLIMNYNIYYDTTVPKISTNYLENTI